MAKVQIKGVIVPNDIKWIYDWFEIDAVCPKDVDRQIADANGEDLEVEINSGGGDVYAGSEIYTALKAYTGNVTVKIIGIAASAAGVIAMSGKKVLISPTAQFMMHNVSSGAWGDYRALEHEAAVLKNYNISIANSYVLKTGMKQEELLELMNKETWLNAQQALRYGFVDEVMFDDSNQLVASVNSFVLPPEVINKIRNLVKNQDQNINAGRSTKNNDQSLETGQPAGLNNAQSTQLPQESAQPQPANNQKEEEKLEIKNVDELRQHFPDLVAQVEAAAKAEGEKDGVTKGATAERQRIQSIDEIANTVDPALVAKAKYDEPMTAEALAFAALKADAGKGRQYLDNHSSDSNDSGVAGITGQPQGTQGNKEQEKSEREQAAKNIAEFANKRRK